MTLNTLQNKHQLRTIFLAQIGLLGLLGLLYILEGWLPGKNEIGILWFGVVMGALGASISLMRRLYQNKDVSIPDLGGREFFTVLMPILYGTLMAGVAYLLFLSKVLASSKLGDVGALISTPLFPAFVTKANLPVDATILEQFKATTVNGVEDAAKMLVWCFLAGYSEGFVTGILKQLEGKTRE